MTDLLSRENFLHEVKFGTDGLVPVIAQSIETGAVLMLAWMNRETLEETLSTGHVTYWSRSRASRWRKGETSGNCPMPMWIMSRILASTHSARFRRSLMSTRASPICIATRMTRFVSSCD